MLYEACRVWWMHLFIYSSYWLFSQMHFCFLGTLFFWRTLRSPTEMWVEFDCYCQRRFALHCWGLWWGKSSYLELNEIKMMARNLTFKILFNIFIMSNIRLMYKWNLNMLISYGKYSFSLYFITIKCETKHRCFLN